MSDQPDISMILDKVREHFLKFDSDLITKRAHEQSISQRLAAYLEQLLPEWHVNCEYNRQGMGTDPKLDATGAKRRPDIIVHRRGHDRENLLVIEVKPEWAGAEIIEQDRTKLINLLLPPRSYTYAFLAIYTDQPEPNLLFSEVEIKQ